MEPMTLTQAQVWKARLVGGLVGIVTYGLVCLAFYGMLARPGARFGPLSPDRLTATMAVVFAVGVPLVAWITARGWPPIAEAWAQRRARRGQPVTHNLAGERAATTQALKTIVACTVCLVVMVAAGWWVVRGWVAPTPPMERIAVASAVLMLVALWVVRVVRRYSAMLEALQQQRARQDPQT
jgi:hypothetical protein